MKFTLILLFGLPGAASVEDSVKGFLRQQPGTAAATADVTTYEPCFTSLDATSDLQVVENATDFQKCKNVFIDAFKAKMEAKGCNPNKFNKEFEHHVNIGTSPSAYLVSQMTVLLV